MDDLAGSPLLETLSVPGVIDLTSHSRPGRVVRTGFADPETVGTWTNGPAARLAFLINPDRSEDFLLTVEMSAFVAPPLLPVQIVDVSVNGVASGSWTVGGHGWHERPMILPARLPGGGGIGGGMGGGMVTLDFAIATCRSPAALGIGPDIRPLGIMIRRIVLAPFYPVSESADPESGVSPLPGRLVGSASRRTYDEKVRTGFWSKYLGGPRVLDIGCKGNDAAGTPLSESAGLPIIETAIGVDLDYPGYDGRTLPFASESQDAVYSSHALEHIPDYMTAIQEWHRVVRGGGHIIVVVPHAHLYERRRRPPSRWNLGHARMYTAASLLAEFEAALPPNSYRVRHLLEDDRGYRYQDSPEHHASGGHEIELVVQKIRPPEWHIEE